MKKRWVYIVGFLLASIGAVVALGMYLSDESISPPMPLAGMAPLKNDPDVYAYYRLEFLPDGYPGRRTKKHGLIPHPIYGPYIISDYLSQHHENPSDPIYLSSARKVADAAIDRMSRHGEALVFWYPPNLSSMPGQFYSGLTQARYLDVFHRMHKSTGDQKYADAASRAFKSLTIPVSEGGVMKRTRYGAVIEEWPHEIATYTLNGWTSALTILDRYANETGNQEAKTFLDENLSALESLLPLFDAPHIANSRYKLIGYSRIRVNSSVRTRVESGSVEIPGEGSYSIKDSTSVWHNHIRSRDANETLINVVLSRYSYPAANVLRLEIDAITDGEATIALGTGPYSVHRSSPEFKHWVTLATVSLKMGRNALSVEIPWDTADLVSYPTNFAKTFAGKSYNVYHFIHISTLKALHARSGRQTLHDYATKWEGYVEKWPAMEPYKSAGVELTNYTRGNRAP